MSRANAQRIVCVRCNAYSKTKINNNKQNEPFQTTLYQGHCLVKMSSKTTIQNIKTRC